MDDDVGHYFWRAYAKTNGVWRIVDGLFYHTTVNGAVAEFKDIGEIVLRSRGIGRNEVAEAKVVVQVH